MHAAAAAAAAHPPPETVGPAAQTPSPDRIMRRGTGGQRLELEASGSSGSAAACDAWDAALPAPNAKRQRLQHAATAASACSEAASSSRNAPNAMPRQLAQVLRHTGQRDDEKRLPRLGVFLKRTEKENYNNLDVGDSTIVMEVDQGGGAGHKTIRIGGRVYLERLAERREERKRTFVFWAGGQEHEGKKKVGVPLFVKNGPHFDFPVNWKHIATRSQAMFTKMTQVCRSPDYDTIIWACQQGANRSGLAMTCHLCWLTKNDPRDCLHYLQSLRGIVEVDEDYNVKLDRLLHGNDDVPPPLDALVRATRFPHSFTPVCV